MPPAGSTAAALGHGHGHSFPVPGLSSSLQILPQDSRCQGNKEEAGVGWGRGGEGRNIELGTREGLDTKPRRGMMAEADAWGLGAGELWRGRETRGG